MTPPIVNILNTVTGAADATIAAGKVAFPNVTNFPSIDYLGIQESVYNATTVYTPVTSPVFAAGCKRALQEQSTSISITAVTANSTKYAFTIEQNVADSATGVSRLQVIPFSFTTDSTATDAELGTGLVNAINGSSSLKVTASYTAATPGTVVVVVVAQPVANGGSAIISVVPQSNVTVSATPVAILSAGGASVISAISNAANRQVTFSGNHGLSNGNTIIISGCSGGTAPSSVNGIPFQVEVVNATVVKLLGSTAAGTVTGFAAVSVVKPGQEPFGQYADVLQSLVAAGSSNLPTSGQQYAQVNLVYNTSDSDLLNTQRQDFNQAILWINQGSATSTTTAPDANYLLLETQVATILGGGGSAYLAVPAP